jgi:hypothetical protein
MGCICATLILVQLFLLLLLLLLLHSHPSRPGPTILLRVRVHGCTVAQRLEQVLDCRQARSQAGR